MESNTSNSICRCIVELLGRHGVRKAFVSPGSRNAPLLLALSRSKEIDSEVVVDERSAAFMALGYSLVSREPVCLICTSGSALLDYAPAVAEAYYRRVPLIVISADRPKHWIGQDDSQTIVQPGALSNVVKRSYDIGSNVTDDELWYANRVTNDALLTALTGRIGPVHLNVQLSEPLNGVEQIDREPFHVQRTIDILKPKAALEVSVARQLGCLIASPAKVMIVCGFLNPDKVLNKALARLSRLPNFVVLTETVSNLHGDNFISSLYSTLAAIKGDDQSRFEPDYVISCGGALISHHVKRLLRKTKLKGHWHVGELDDTVDCFRQLTMRIEMSPAIFFQQLASAMQPHLAPCEYAGDWQIMKNRADSLTASYVARIGWSDLKAFATFIPMIPRRWNVHFSNGTPIRYAQIFANHQYHRCDCNRGVSGIDGCTSTAIGASLAYRNDVTLLISGDTCAIYDIGALAASVIPPRFKMIVIDNEGGGIFRFIGSTSQLDIRERMLCAPQKARVEAIAEAVGFKVFEADNEVSLRASFRQFADESQQPALLVVHTRGCDSASVLKEFFNFCKSN